MLGLGEKMWKEEVGQGEEVGVGQLWGSVKGS